MESYPVLWSAGEGAVSAGKLELAPTELRLDGAEWVRVGYRQILSVRVGRRIAERLRGRPALVLELAGGRSLQIGSLGAPGTLHELAERLSLLVGVPSAA